MTVDEVGSVQEIGPPGVVAPGKRGKRGRDRTGFDPGKSPTDADLEKIGHLNNLRRLFLTGSAVTDAGVVHLNGLDRLTWLDLSHTRVGDAGLRHLVGLKRLEWLDLSYTEVSDKSIKSLQNMKFAKGIDFSDRKSYPKGVNLSYSKITREGFWQLLLTPAPWCHVRENDGHLWGSLKKPDGTTVWPKKFAGGKSERDRTLCRLLLLGCDLTAGKDDRIVSAWVTMTPPTATLPAYHTKEQALEVFGLLAKLGTVERVKIDQPWSQHPALGQRGNGGHRYSPAVDRFGHDGLLAHGGRLVATGRNDSTPQAEPTIRQDQRRGLQRLHKALLNCEIDGQPIFDNKTPVTRASPEAVLSELRRRFPGKSDDQIIEILRSYISIDPSGGGQGQDWLAYRLQRARNQWQAVRAIQKNEGTVYYDYEIDKSDELIKGAKPSGPPGCENCWETISSMRRWPPARA